MTISRRILLHLAAGTVALPALSKIAKAQTYPTRPVRILVGFPAGGAADILARLIGQYLSERFGQPFIVEDRPGAGTNIATEAVVQASPDGYTLLLVTTSNAINATFYSNLRFNFIRDIAPIAGIFRVPNVMEVNPSVPANTVPEFVAYARSHPGKINMASSGNATTPHVAGEMFKMMTGIDMLHVPYKNNPLPDLISGQVQLYFGPIPSSLGYIQTDKLRALAVTGATRSALLPNVPTVSETLSGYEASSWEGLGAPKNTPVEIIDKLNSAINAALDDAQFKARISSLGGTPLGGSVADFTKLIAEETEKWARVVKFANIKPD